LKASSVIFSGDDDDGEPYEIKGIVKSTILRRKDLETEYEWQNNGESKNKKGDE
jgi:hypothetical protein